MSFVYEEIENSSCILVNDKVTLAAETIIQAFSPLVIRLNKIIKRLNQIAYHDNQNETEVSKSNLSISRKSILESDLNVTSSSKFDILHHSIYLHPTNEFEVKITLTMSNLPEKLENRADDMTDKFGNELIPPDTGEINNEETVEVAGPSTSECTTEEMQDSSTPSHIEKGDSKGQEKGEIGVGGGAVPKQPNLCINIKTPSSKIKLSTFNATLNNIISTPPYKQSNERSGLSMEEQAEYTNCFTRMLEADVIASINNFDNSLFSSNTKSDHVVRKSQSPWDWIAITPFAKKFKRATQLETKSLYKKSSGKEVNSGAWLDSEMYHDSFDEEAHLNAFNNRYGDMLDFELPRDELDELKDVEDNFDATAPKHGVLKKPMSSKVVEENSEKINEPYLERLIKCRESLKSCPWTIEEPWGTFSSPKNRLTRRIYQPRRNHRGSTDDKVQERCLGSTISNIESNITRFMDDCLVKPSSSQPSIGARNNNIRLSPLKRITTNTKDLAQSTSTSSSGTKTNKLEAKCTCKKPCFSLESLYEAYEGEMVPVRESINQLRERIEELNLPIVIDFEDVPEWQDDDDELSSTTSSLMNFLAPLRPVPPHDPDIICYPISELSPSEYTDPEVLARCASVRYCRPRPRREISSSSTPSTSLMNDSGNQNVSTSTQTPTDETETRSIGTQTEPIDTFDKECSPDSASELPMPNDSESDELDEEASTSSTSITEREIANIIDTQYITDLLADFNLTPNIQQPLQLVDPCEVCNSEGPCEHKLESNSQEKIEFSTNDNANHPDQ